ncbi:MAG: type II secretion system F family protein [Acidobacteria bacterium]|nr:type II secretion system F family protein [Acidobacteriota bacterium]
MAEYSYKAVTPEGKAVEGSLDAENERAVLGKLQDLGYFPIRVSAGKDAQESAFGFRFGQKKKVKVKDLLHFTGELNTLLRSGLPLDRSLMILEELSEKTVFREIVHDIIKKIKGGKSLSDAMAEHPEAFPKVYVNMMKAGEAGGIIPQVLSELTAYLERTEELRSYLVSALIYPCIVVLMMVVSVLVMFFFVIPKFASVFDGTTMPVPMAMQFLLGISNFASSWWWAFLAVFIVLGISAWQFRVSPKGRRVWDEKVLKLPLFGKLMNRIEVARFSRTLGTLLQSAVPMVSALTLVKEVVRNQVVANALEPIKSGVKKGEGLTGPMKKTGIFPPLALHLIEVGEETGNLSAMMLQAADVFEKEVRVEIKRLINLLEPFLILLMGVMVGAIVLTMVNSIFSIGDIPT